MAPDRPLRHLIKGHVLTETSGESPPGDPLDDSGDDDGPQVNSRVASKFRKLLSQSSTSKSGVKEPTIDEAGPSGTAPKQRHYACKSVKQATTSPAASSRKPDSNLLSPELLLDDNWSDGEESHLSDCSSTRTSLDRIFSGTATTEQLLKRYGDRACDNCSETYPQNYRKISKRFCSGHCAKSYADMPVKPTVRKKKVGSSSSSSIKSRLRDTSVSTYCPSHASTDISSRRSSRGRNRPYVATDSEGEDFADSDDNASSVPTTSSRSARSERSTAKQRSSGLGPIKMVKIEPTSSHGSSPEIPCASTAANVSPLRRSSSTSMRPRSISGSSKMDMSESGQKKLRASARVPSLQEQNFLKGLSDYVKTIIEKPVVSWNIDEVAAFGNDCGGEKLATKLLLGNVDGQALVLFDQPKIWDLLNVKPKLARDLINQVKLLESFQRDTLKEQLQERKRQFAAAVAYLERTAG